MFKAPVFLLALAGTLVSVPAFAAADDQTAPAAAEAPKKDKTVCRRETFVGSNVPQKTCRKESEWRQIDSAAKRAFQDRDTKGN